MSQLQENNETVPDPDYDLGRYAREHMAVRETQPQAVVPDYGRPRSPLLTVILIVIAVLLVSIAGLVLFTIGTTP